MDFIRIGKNRIVQKFSSKKQPDAFYPYTAYYYYCVWFLERSHKAQSDNWRRGGLFLYDFVFIIWNVLSGLGIIGLLFVLFAAFQFFR